ncbi:hypothetical protein POM88_015886 [Heracleum sosnowskyi]|uniref:NAD-dependent epimerase/dehydratase domain-containing protein n=1 Tax=Heracleum sosnowskyi TaxID=360622 RepID=A0AAD8MXY3_9APIA|nr:hypothetical protein POM88_015886 [Heracleum sosnowskyi]
MRFMGRGMGMLLWVIMKLLVMAYGRSYGVPVLTSRRKNVVISIARTLLRHSRLFFTMEKLAMCTILGPKERRVTDAGKDICKLFYKDPQTNIKYVETGHLLIRVKPTYVLNAAGVTGRPKAETIRTNVTGTLTLADVCREQGLMMINFATGCILQYDSAHPEGPGIGFKEKDKPNFHGSFYSRTKAMNSGKSMTMSAPSVLDAHIIRPQ